MITDGGGDEPIDSRPEFDAVVVDLAGVRLERGFSKRPTRCHHLRLSYDTYERRIWCRDCKRTVEGYDAFMVLANRFEKMTRAAKRLYATATAAKNANLHRIAAKKLATAWSGRKAVGCPHCKRGLLAEDFETLGTVYRDDFEKRRRAKEKGEPNE